MRISDWSSDVCSSDLARRPSADHLGRHSSCWRSATRATSGTDHCRRRNRIWLCQSLFDVDGHRHAWHQDPGSSPARPPGQADDRQGRYFCVSDHCAHSLVAVHGLHGPVPPYTVAVVPCCTDCGGDGLCSWRSHPVPNLDRSEEHTSELQSLMRISYAVL